MIKSQKIKSRDFFYCYDEKLKNRLEEEFHIKPILAARHLTTKHIFNLYQQTDDLGFALKMIKNSLKNTN